MATTCSNITHSTNSRYLYLYTDILYYRPMTQNYEREIAALLKASGALRPRDLEKRGIPRKYLYSLLEKGTIQRSSRGVYLHPNSRITENHSFVEVSCRVPTGVICLLSALRFHEITTQNPFQVWIAIDPKARKPQLEYPAIKVVRFSGQALSKGIETHRIEGSDIKVFSIAKTVADCFKYRNKIGIDVAVEALRDTLKQRKATPSEIEHFARICRVSAVMRPYMEALI